MTKIAAITVLAVLFTSSKAFSIGALPATITAGEGELLTWVRNPVEPTSFQLATGTLALERIDATVSVGTGETQGTLPVTFKAPRRVTLVAYDLHLEVRLGHQAAPFFFDHNTITIVSAIPTTSQTFQTTPTPSSSPQNSSLRGAATTQTTSTSSQNSTPQDTAMASQTNRDGSVELPDTPTTTSEITTRSTVNGNTIPSRGSATSNRQPTPITSSPSTGVTPSQAPKSAGAIAGGVLGGIFALAIVTAFVFLLLKRRNKKLKYGNYGLTPFHDITAPNLARTDINLKERNRQVLGEQLVPQRYPDNDQTDDIGSNRPGDDTIQVLRHQVYVVTQRMVALEAGLAPPDYNSHL